MTKNTLIKKIASVFMAAAVALTAVGIAAAEAQAADETYYYGTAALSFTEYYEGENTSLSSYDAVSTATTNKYALFDNEDTEITYAADGTTVESYVINGVKNVPVRVAASDWNALSEAQQAATGITLNSDKTTETAVYKTYNVKTGKYSATEGTTVTVDDATVSIETNARWGACAAQTYGNYQINITETSTSYIQNTRVSDDTENPYAVSGDSLLGAIVKTASGKSYGMRFSMETWVQPYEIAWNSDINGLGALEGQTITEVVYLTTNGVYDYKFAASAKVKKHISGSAKVLFNDNDTLTVTGVSALSKVSDLTASVYYMVGKAKTYVVENASVSVDAVGQVKIDLPASVDESGNTAAQTFAADTLYYVVLSTAKYADTVAVATYSDGATVGTLSKPAIKKAVSTKKKKATVTWKKVSGAAKYQIKYVTGSTTKTVTVTGTSKTLSSLKSGKTYKIYVRAISKSGLSSAWSSVKKVKVK